MDWLTITLVSFLIGIGVTALVLMAMVFWKMRQHSFSGASAGFLRGDLPQEVEKNMNSNTVADFPLVDESIDNVDKSTRNYLKKHPGYVVVSISIVLAFYTLLFFSDTQIIQVYFIPAYALLLGYFYLLDRVRHEFMRQFAAANDFSYATKGTLDGLTGTLFRIGRNKSVSDVVTGQFRGRPLSLFFYQYVTSQGESSQTHSFTIFQFQMSANMPDFLLENKNHNFGESFSDVLADSVTLELEGDFNRFFSLKVPRGYEIEALEVFSPDVMADIEDKCRSLSLEIVGNQLYIYKDTEVNSKKNLYLLYGCAIYFEEKLAPVLSRMKRSLEAMKNIS